MKKLGIVNLMILVRMRIFIINMSIKNSKIMLVDRVSIARYKMKQAKESKRTAKTIVKNK